MYLIPKSVLAVTSAAEGTKGNREYLKGVSISETNEGVRYECTDCHRLIRIDTPKQDVDSFPNISGFDRNANGQNQALIPAANFSKIIKSHKNKTPLPILDYVAMTITDKSVTFATTDINTANVQQVPLIPESFPKTDQVIPSYAKPDCVTVRFNARYLRDMAQSVMDFQCEGGGNVAVTLTILSKPIVKNPVLFTAENAGNDKFTGVLMPMLKR